MQDPLHALSQKINTLLSCLQKYVGFFRVFFVYGHHEETDKAG